MLRREARLSLSPLISRLLELAAFCRALVVNASRGGLLYPVALDYGALL